MRMAAQPPPLRHNQTQDPKPPRCVFCSPCRFYLNSFYPPDQVTLPYSLVEAAVGMANVVAAPLAASLLLLDGKNGMHGWQWCVPASPLGLSWVWLGWFSLCILSAERVVVLGSLRGLVHTATSSRC